jgi:hypothetical protein
LHSTLPVGEVKAAGMAPAPMVDAAPSISKVRQQVLETMFARACVGRTTFTKNDIITVRWPDDLAVSGELAIRIMTASGRIYLERHATVTAGTVLNLGHAYLLPEGAYQIVIMPTPGEYHAGGLRIARRIEIDVKPRQTAPILAVSRC